MHGLLPLIPLLPALSAVTLIVFGRMLPHFVVGVLGVGSVGLAAVLVALIGSGFLQDGEAFTVHLWQWMAIASFSIDFAFHFDGLTLVMLCVITGVGFLIHLYSAEFMAEDSDFPRFFAYMNLFVAAMLVLVLADNLLLLYLGWEGVGLCSYLLIGFWYQDPANGAAARKAFVVTRVGDTAMALGLFLLVAQLGTLNIAEIAAEAPKHWAPGTVFPVLAAMLLLGGAVGKSAQLPLQTWLPDAMAGPTPVSALIHAATMVTAGVYLIARNYELYLLAPQVLTVVAVVGLGTALIAAFAAITQHDIKRILAYSTISQIGYMFLGLGVAAWQASIFHLVTHAFFKALLFLGAGAVIHCLHHEHDIFRMGGLRTRLPVAFWSFLIGSAALAALPLTSGFYSKDLIVLAAWELPGIGSVLWIGALLGAFLTAVYSFRLVFTVFFGELKTEPDRQPGWVMNGPLILLCFLSIAGGWLSLPLDAVFPAREIGHHGLVGIISIGVPLLGLGVAYLLFLGRQVSIDAVTGSAAGASLQRFWFGGWGFDSLYALLFTRPFVALARVWKSEPIDHLYHAVVAFCLWWHRSLSRTQTGHLGWYAGSMVLGLILLLSLVVGWGR